MTKYIYLYKGAATDIAAMPQEQQESEMAAWGAWYGQHGAAIIDGGAPFGMGASVLDNGNAGSAASLTGYTVVEAADMDAAKAMTAGHPFLSDGNGEFAIDIFELIDMTPPE